MRTSFGRMAAFAFIAMLFSVSLAIAGEKDKEKEGDRPAGAQQNKMKVCNAEAAKKNLKGDERRAFMSSCLKG
ncbi:MAG TPA: PsiF family protein [Usitatibacter sp.]|nr:PsiF family protein [Usitatibacter sp.]